MKSRGKAKILTDESPCPCDGKERLEPRNIQNTRTPYNAKARRQKKQPRTCRNGARTRRVDIDAHGFLLFAFPISVFPCRFQRFSVSAFFPPLNPQQIQQQIQIAAARFPAQTLSPCQPNENNGPEKFGRLHIPSGGSPPGTGQWPVPPNGMIAAVSEFELKT